MLAHFHKKKLKPLKYSLNHFLSSTGLSIRLNISVYKTIILPILFYDTPLYSNITKSTEKKLAKMIHNGKIQKTVKETAILRG